MQKEVPQKTDISDEIKIQDNLEKASESFSASSILGCEVKEFTYKSNFSYNKNRHALEYNGVKYKITDENIDASLSIGDTVYVPVFKVDYGGVPRSFIESSFYTCKEDANSKIESMRKYHKKESFRYHIESEDYIIHNKSLKLFEWLCYSDINLKANHVVSIVMVLLWISISMSIWVDNIIYYGSFQLGLILVGFLYALEPRITDFSRYRAVDIEVKSNNLDKKDINYKSITVDVSLDEAGLQLYSDELDCSWSYKRKGNYQIVEDGRDLLKKLPIENGTCVITVKNSGIGSQWASDCCEWTISL